MYKLVDDMTIAVFYMKHIDDPCIDPATGQNIRDFYLREAGKVLTTLKNPFARDLLENKIKEYRR